MLKLVLKPDRARPLLQGYPLNINDFKVLLDGRVYTQLDGQWLDLFNRLKWDTIKSVMRSVLGLQGKKFNVRLVCQA